MFAQMNISTNENLTISLQSENIENKDIGESSEIFNELITNISKEYEPSNFSPIKETAPHAKQSNLMDDQGSLITDHQGKMRKENELENSKIELGEIITEPEEETKDIITISSSESNGEDFNLENFEVDSEQELSETEEKRECIKEGTIESFDESCAEPNIEGQSLIDTTTKVNIDENRTSKSIPQELTENTQIGTNKKDGVKYSIESKSNVKEETTQSIEQNTISRKNEISNTESNFNSPEENHSEIAKDKHNLFKQIEDGITSSTTSKNINIMLKPKQLGTVNVNLKFINNALELNISVENTLVENTLKENLENLEKLFSSGNIVTINSVNIQTRTDEYDRRSLEKNKKSYSEFLKKNAIIKKQSPMFFI